MSDAQACQDCFKIRVLEGVSVMLFDEYLAIQWNQIVNDLPCVTAAREVFIGMSDPDDRYRLVACLCDEAGNVTHDRCPVASRQHHVILHVDDNQRGIRSSF